MNAALSLYRDDGPIARVLGKLLRLPAPFLLVAVAAAPMFVLIAWKGAAASHVAVGVVLAWLVLVGGATSGVAPGGGLRWAVPPVLRVSEYAGILWIGALAGHGAEPAAFALLAALTFRHYDLVYRLRHRGVAPPGWLGNVAGGWDGRLVLGYILLVANALPAGFFIAAGLLAAVFVAESIAGWRTFGRAEQPVTYEDEEDEGQ
jgi:hypothetical protein